MYKKQFQISSIQVKHSANFFLFQSMLRTNQTKHCPYITIKAYTRIIIKTINYWHLKRSKNNAKQYVSSKVLKQKHKNIIKYRQSLQTLTTV